MTDSTGPSAPRPDGVPRDDRPGAADSRPAQQQTRNSWALPLGALVVGLLLGGLGMYLARGSGTPAATSTPAPTTVTVTASPTAPATTTPTTTPMTGAATAAVTVPPTCLRLADEASAMREVSEQAARAAQNLDATALSEAVRRLGEAQDRLNRTADQCRASGVTVTTTR
ncbi:MAG: hypothetical protein KDB39_19750 [Austwickia sp.]|nr:hypothetical protein [Austwickia sp.]